MKNDIKQQAKELYYQTDLTKTQIAAVLGISRTSLHYWIKENNWDRLKTSAEHLPSILAEKCYHILSQVADSYLSERRITNPVGRQEAETMYKIMLTIKQLKNRSTVNESMEMFALLQDRVKKSDPKLAEDIFPYIEEHLAARAAVTTGHLLPEGFTPMGRLPFEPIIDTDEQALDNKEIFDYVVSQMGGATIDPLPTNTLPQSSTTNNNNDNEDYNINTTTLNDNNLIPNPIPNTNTNPIQNTDPNNNPNTNTDPNTNDTPNTNNNPNINNNPNTTNNP